MDLRPRVDRATGALRQQQTDAYARRHGCRVMTHASPPAVIVADADGASRAALAALVRGARIPAVEAASGEEVLALARAGRPLAVVLEVDLPGLSGYEVCHELREDFGDRLPIVFVTGVRTAPYDRVAALLIGADDLIAKPYHSDELLARLRRLVGRAASTGGRRRRSARDHGLTPREHEVLTLLSQGLGQAEIAQRLVVAQATVSTHIQHVLAKLGAHSRAEAVALAHREHLVG